MPIPRAIRETKTTGKDDTKAGSTPNTPIITSPMVIITRWDRYLSNMGVTAIITRIDAVGIESIISTDERS